VQNHNLKLTGKILGSITTSDLLVSPVAFRERFNKQGLTLVSTSQRNLSRSCHGNTLKPPNVSLKRCSRHPEKWTSVSPCQQADPLRVHG